MIILEAAKLAWRNPAVVLRNPSGVTQGARDAYETAKAVRAYRADQKAKDLLFCRWCGDESDIHVHHVEPVSVAPELAAVPGNFLLLCSTCHLHVAHAGRWTRYVKNVRNACRLRDLRVTR